MAIISTFATAAVLLVLSPVVAAQDYRPMVVFQNGLLYSVPEKYFCNDVAFATFVSEVRKLDNRALSSTESTESTPADDIVPDVEVDPPTEHRELWTSARCRTVLRYVEPGCAGGNRRKLQMKRPGLRKLQYSDTCSEAALIQFGKNMDTVIDRMIKNRTMKPNCKDYLTTRRDISCRQKVSCEITAFNLWDGDTDSMVRANLNSTGTTICRSLNANIEAVTEFFAGTVYFKLTGPQTQTSSEAHKPYLLGANDAEDIMGSNYRPGNYTLTAWSDNDPSIKNMTFTVLDC